MLYWSQINSLGEKNVFPGSTSHSVHATPPSLTADKLMFKSVFIRLNVLLYQDVNKNTQLQQQHRNLNIQYDEGCVLKSCVKQRKLKGVKLFRGCCVGGVCGLNWCSCSEP